MASFRTGETVNEIIFSINNSNAAVTPATFDIDTYRNGSVYTGLTVSMTLLDATTGAYGSSWSASTTGDYQIYYKNNSTSVIYITDTHQVLPDSDFDSVKVFVGL